MMDEARGNGLSNESGNVLEENGVKVLVKSNHNVPGKCTVFFNEKMRINREFCLCALAAYVDTQKNSNKNISCLDAFSATGASGLLWKRHLGSAVDVTVNDSDPNSADEMNQNILLNGMRVIDSAETGTDDGIHVTCFDANIIMHQRQFSFIHLDPFGTAAVYFDAALCNVYNGGIVVVTATDIAALYGTCPAPAKRNYGANVIRTDYFKELAVRTVAAGVARSAAKCNKGVKILYSVAAEHFLQIAFLIRRGAQHADRSLLHVRDILHCQNCQQWAVNDNPCDVLYGNVSGLLGCRCFEQHHQKTAVILGPVWCGDIFDVDFVNVMQSAAVKLQVSSFTRHLLGTIYGESCLNGRAIEDNDCGVEQLNPLEDKGKLCAGPLFYHCLHRRHITGVDLPKSEELVQLLRSAGFKAAITHFDVRGAVRTDARLEDILCVLYEHCRQRCKQSETQLLKQLKAST